MRRNALIGLLLAVLVTGALAWVFRAHQEPITATAKPLTISQAEAAAKAGTLTKATVTIGEPTVDLTVSGLHETTVVPIDQLKDFRTALADAGTTVTYVEAAKPDAGNPVINFLVSNLPLLLFGLGFGLLIVWSVRRTTGGTKAAKSARVSELPDKTLGDVAGQAEAVEQAREVLGLLRNADQARKQGIPVPSGILLAGPPGNGKTLIAKAIAGELGAPFFALSGSDFVEKFVGIGAKTVRTLFAEATKAAKEHGYAIIFIDEIDAIGRKRTSGDADGGTTEKENTLNALLVALDGFSDHAGVYVIGATNRADILDTALTRPGRFGKTITLNLPDRAGRAEIFQLYLDRRAAKGHLTAGADFDADEFASRLLGLSGAEIEEVVGEAARRAFGANRSTISRHDFEDALGKVVLGPEKKSLIMTEDERTLTAWHEAGHAVAAFLEPHSNPAIQVTIVPRGFAGGVTWRAPREALYPTKESYEAELVVAMGGKAAELILLDGTFTTGPGSDCRHASATAIAMVAEHGFSDLGSLRREELMRISPAITEQVAEVAQKLLDDALWTATRHFAEHRDFLVAVADELLEKETLHENDLCRIWEAVNV